MEIPSLVLAALFQDVVDEPQVRVPELQQRVGVYRDKKHGT